MRHIEMGGAFDHFPYFTGRGDEPMSGQSDWALACVLRGVAPRGYVFSVEEKREAAAEWRTRYKVLPESVKAWAREAHKLAHAS